MQQVDILWARTLELHGRYTYSLFIHVHPLSIQGKTETLRLLNGNPPTSPISYKPQRVPKFVLISITCVGDGRCVYQSVWVLVSVCLCPYVGGLFSLCRWSRRRCPETKKGERSEVEWVTMRGENSKVQVIQTLLFVWNQEANLLQSFLFGNSLLALIFLALLLFLKDLWHNKSTRPFQSYYVRATLRLRVNSEHTRLLDLVISLQLSALHPIHEHHILYAIQDIAIAKVMTLVRVKECYLTLTYQSLVSRGLMLGM